MKNNKAKLVETKIFLTEEETRQLIAIANADGNRSRKNFCEKEIRLIIESRRTLPLKNN